MKDLTGWLALALVGLWVGYLVPHKLRYRQQLVESRVDDRFSDALRVVAVSDRPARDRAQATASPGDCRPAGTSGLLTPGRGVLVAATGTATGGRTMDRPTAQHDRLTAEVARRTAQARAQHAAAVARRGAAARRRGMLAGGLAVLTVLGTVLAAALPAVTWPAGAVPAALLTTVVVLGRRAVVAGRAADAAFAARMEDAARAAAEARARAARAVTGAQRVVHPAVTGHAVRPSDTPTQMIARVVVDDDESWEPVPVPRPTYAMKAPAPRREPVPLTNLEGSTSAAPAATVVEETSDEAPQTPAASVAAPAVTVPAAVAAPSTTGSIDLDAILARRRASGM